MTMLYRVSSQFKKKYIWGEVLNKNLEEGDKYPDIPRCTNLKEWQTFYGTMHLGIQTGKVWGDLLFWGLQFLINEKVKNFLEKEQITGYRLYNVEFPKNPEAPKYYGIMPTGEAIPFEVNKRLPDGFNVYLGDWDGADVSSDCGASLLCSQKFKEVFEKYKIDNIKFKPLDPKEYIILNEKFIEKKGFLKKMFSKKWFRR